MLKMGLRFLPYILVLLTYLSFVNQAYHIDDRIYLQIADNIQEKPLYPYDFDALFEGFTAPDAASHSHLPLTSYYLALIQLLNPEMTEWVVHLAFIIFPLLAVYGFSGLAKRLVSFHQLATLLFAASTGFLVLSHTLMPDVPFMAFWMVSLRHFLEIASGNPRPRDWFLCGAALLGASFLSLLGIGLVMLFLVYPFLQSRLSGNQRIAWSKLFILVSLPFSLWVIWYLRGYLHYERFVLINTFTHMEHRAFLAVDLILTKVLSFIMNTGATSVFPLLAWFAFFTRRSLFSFLGLFGLSTLGMIWMGSWSWQHALLFGLFLSTGLLILLYLALAGIKLAVKILRNPSDSSQSKTPAEKPFKDIHSADLALMFLWILGIAFACVTVFYSGSTRYTFLASPPLILLVLHFMEKRYGHQQLLPTLVGICLAGTLLYSLTISYGDYLFAESYRRATREICQEYVNDDSTVFYTGEWGFRYYMDQFGAKPITKSGLEAEVGDIIVKPYVALPWVTLYDGDEYSQLLEKRIIQLPYPVRILDFNSHAGFYSTGWGKLPVSLAVQPRWEWFNVYQVTRKYDGPIPELEIPY